MQPPPEPAPAAGASYLDAYDAPLRAYLTSRGIAEEYDVYFKDSALFAYDKQVLDGWFPKPASLLDLGCGTGRLLVPFARRRFSVTGVDLSEPMLEVCRRKILQERLMARLLRGDMRQLPTLPDGHFVYAVCMFSTLGMLRGAAERLRALREIRRLLQPGGRLALHVHNAWYPGNLRFGWASVAAQGLRDLVPRLDSEPEFGDRVFADYRGIANMFLHTYTASELRGQLRETGFEILDWLPLNAARDGRLRGPLTDIRANGFLVHARRI